VPVVVDDLEPVVVLTHLERDILGPWEPVQTLPEALLSAGRREQREVVVAPLVDAVAFGRRPHPDESDNVGICLGRCPQLVEERPEALPDRCRCHDAHFANTSRSPAQDSTRQ
jgi:hypothetical protein